MVFPPRLFEIESPISVYIMCNLVYVDGKTCKSFELSKFKLYRTSKLPENFALF